MISKQQHIDLHMYGLSDPVSNTFALPFVLARYRVRSMPVIEDVTRLETTECTSLNSIPDVSDFSLLNLRDSCGSPRYSEKVNSLASLSPRNNDKIDSIIETVKKRLSLKDQQKKQKQTLIRITRKAPNQTIAKRESVKGRTKLVETKETTPTKSLLQSKSSPPKDFILRSVKSPKATKSQISAFEGLQKDPKSPIEDQSPTQSPNKTQEHQDLNRVAMEKFIYPANDEKQTPKKRVRFAFVSLKNRDIEDENGVEFEH